MAGLPNHHFFRHIFDIVPQIFGRLSQCHRDKAYPACKHHNNNDYLPSDRKCRCNPRGKADCSKARKNLEKKIHEKPVLPGKKYFGNRQCEASAGNKHYRPQDKQMGVSYCFCRNLPLAEVQGTFLEGPPENNAKDNQHGRYLDPPGD